MKKWLFIMPILQTHYHFKLDFLKVDQHTGGKWLIHGTNHYKDNQLKSMELRLKFFTKFIIHTLKDVCFIRV